MTFESHSYSFNYSKFSISESLWLDFEMCLFGLDLNSNNSLYSFNSFNFNCTSTD